MRDGAIILVTIGYAVQPFDECTNIANMNQAANTAAIFRRNASKTNIGSYKCEMHIKYSIIIGENK